MTAASGKRTAKQAILDRLREAGRALATHELGLVGYSENACATRLSELARAGLVVSAVRPGAKYKEWRIPYNSGQQELPLA